MTTDLVVVGGAGGTRARLEDLERASRILGAVADRLVDAGARARVASLALAEAWRLDLNAVASDRTVAALAREAVESVAWVDAGSGGASGVAVDIEDAARNLVETVLLLEEAERTSTSLFAKLGRLWDKAWCLGGLAVWGTRKVVGVGVGWISDRVADAPLAGPLVKPAASAVGWVADVVNPDDGPDVAALLYGADVETALAVIDGSVRATLAVPRAVVAIGGGSMPDDFVEIASSEAALLSGALDDLLGDRCRPEAVAVSSRRRNAPEDLSDLFDRLDGLSPSGEDGAGSVAIERIEHADGSVAWIVEIPGTQDWTPNGAGSVFDITSNLQLMSGHASAVTVGVEDAMRRAGVGVDEPVLIVGHSQGGMAAMALASSPTVLARFRVEAVATAGAPVGRFRPGSRVEVLSLEHPSDLVPALDGESNPDTPTWTTVRRDLGASEDAVDRVADGDLVARHELDAYVRTATEVDASADPSIRRWRDDAGVFFADDGSSSVRTVWRLATPEVDSGIPSDGNPPRG